MVFELLHKCVEENANSFLYQADYQKRYNSLAERYKIAKKWSCKIDDKSMGCVAKRQNVEGFIRTLEQSDAMLIEFDKGLW